MIEFSSLKNTGYLCVFTLVCIYRKKVVLLGFPGSHQEKVTQHQTGIIAVYSILAGGASAKLADASVLSGSQKRQMAGR